MLYCLLYTHSSKSSQGKKRGEKSCRDNSRHHDLHKYSDLPNASIWIMNEEFAHLYILLIRSSWFAVTAKRNCQPHNATVIRQVRGVELLSHNLTIVLHLTIAKMTQPNHSKAHSVNHHQHFLHLPPRRASVASTVQTSDCGERCTPGHLTRPWKSACTSL